MSAAKNRTAGSNREVSPAPEPGFQPTAATTVDGEAEPQAQEYAMMGGMAGAAQPPEEPAQEETEPRVVGGFGFAMGGVRPGGPPDDPNDPNDSEGP
jgi:hypothetical protein